MSPNRITPGSALPGHTLFEEETRRIIAIVNYHAIFELTDDALFLAIDHELVHVRDIALGNTAGWIREYGEEWAFKIGEHHAYLQSVQTAGALGMDSAPYQELVDDYSDELPPNFSYDDWKK